MLNSKNYLYLVQKSTTKSSLFHGALIKWEKWHSTKNEIFEVWAQPTLVAGDMADFLEFSWDVSITVEAGFTKLELQKKQ